MCLLGIQYVKFGTMVLEMKLFQDKVREWIMYFGQNSSQHTFVAHWNFWFKGVKENISEDHAEIFFAV